MLQELWEIDQAHAGLKPQRYTQQPHSAPAHLCVDEQAIHDGSVDVSKLFPCIEWHSAAAPPTYAAFDTLLNELDLKWPNAEIEAKSFLTAVSQTPVMVRAREMLKDLDDPFPRQALNDPQSDAWINFLYEFWFRIPVVAVPLSLPRAAPEPSLGELLDMYHKRDSSLSVRDAIELIGTQSEGRVRPELFRDKPRDFANRIKVMEQVITPMSTQASALRLVRQLAMDLQYFHDRTTSGPTPAFLHVFVGEYDARSQSQTLKLGGYHFWYKCYLDAMNQPVGTFRAEGLRYGEYLEALGMDTPELTTFAFSLRLTDDADHYLELVKQRGGFFNGCSVEGWMAMCMVAFFRSRKSLPNEMQFGNAQVELFVTSGTNMGFPNLLTTVYPKLIGTIT